MAITEKIHIKNTKGLHARPAANFVKLASSFSSKIQVIGPGRKVDGKSIMGMMMLAASHGTELTIIASGQDEAAAINSLVKLAEDNFDRAEDDDLP
ncbi:MAG: HPr family phosphocarrier protein [Gammaproteobacteria bacterium]|nr:MAG: HPr family phosphocarrier protein [Gammaproteobacteria bacterium]